MLYSFDCCACGELFAKGGGLTDKELFILCCSVVIQAREGTLSCLVIEVLVGFVDFYAGFGKKKSIKIDICVFLDKSLFRSICLLLHDDYRFLVLWRSILYRIHHCTALGND